MIHSNRKSAHLHTHTKFYFFKFCYQFGSTQSIKNCECVRVRLHTLCLFFSNIRSDYLWAQMTFYKMSVLTFFQIYAVDHELWTKRLTRSCLLFLLSTRTRTHTHPDIIGSDAQFCQVEQWFSRLALFLRVMAVFSSTSVAIQVHNNPNGIPSTIFLPVWRVDNACSLLAFWCLLQVLMSTRCFSIAKKLIHTPTHTHTHTHTYTLSP